jgi:hypothetical protein
MLFLVIIAMFSLLSGNSYSKDKTPFLPSEYPAEWNVIFYPTRTLWEPANQFSFNTYLGFFPGAPSETVPAGTILAPGTKALPCDIIWEHDVPIVLRDGITIYVDIFRPAGATGKLPTLIGWSPYGKSLPHDPTEHFMGTVPGEWVSGLTRFEGPDPAFWCNEGYAVINVDNRGAFMSEGKIHYWGSVDSADGYEVIEWAAQKEWSNGKVGLYGTSWFAISQWFIAATQPPHLAAIAPWGAHLFDQYRYEFYRGGIPNWFFNMYITSGMTGGDISGVNPNLAEQPWKMVEEGRFPLMAPYWEDKIADMKNIKIPTYIAGPYGVDIEGFKAISSKKKWLRIHNAGEWHDQYDPVSVQDVLSFYDRYLKGVSNDWEKTPAVRLTVLDPGGTEVDRTASSWPLKETQYRKFFLDASNGTLSRHPTVKESSVSYDALTEQTTFTITFPEDTDVVGHLKLRLWVETDGNNDMDLFATVRKVNPADEKDFSVGPNGQIRASLRELDPELSTHFQPVHKFRENKFLSEGQLVPVDIDLLTTGLIFRAGETLRLTVAGNKLAGTAHPVNVGNHIIHTGLKHQSYLQLPIVPSGR